MGEAHRREEWRRQVGIVSRFSRARCIGMQGCISSCRALAILLKILLTPSCSRTRYRDEAADVGVSFKNADGESFRPSPSSAIY